MLNNLSNIRLSKYFYLSGIAYLLMFLACKMPKTIQEDIESIEAITPRLERMVENQISPSLSVLVVKNDSVVYSNAIGHADVPRKLKASPKTVYQWWSITKVFTAIAILQLKEKKLLKLDDPVDKHLPFFKVKSKKRDSKNEITILHLLNHSSGLGDIGKKILGWIHYEGDDPYDQTELVKNELPNYNKLKGIIGEKGRYSNLGYIVLAAVIEKVSNKTYADYIQDNILTPLEMNSTGFDYKNVHPNQIASGSHPQDFMSLMAFKLIDKDKAINEKQNGIYWFNPVFSNQQGSTGLLGSAKDMSHFIIALLNDGKWNGKEILSPESIQLMQKAYVPIVKSPAPKIKPFHFGLPWFVHKDQGELAYSHGGAGAAFVTQVRIFPRKKLGIVVMANSTYLESDMGTTLISKLAKLPW